MRLGTKARLLKAIRVFYGQSPGEFINPHSQITVEKFATEKKHCQLRFQARRRRGL
jgi:hypothetical protein